MEATPLVLRDRKNGNGFRDDCRPADGRLRRHMGRRDTVTCVLIGEGAAQFSSLNAPTNRGQIPSDSPAKTARPNFNTIDFATTGSTKDQTIVISPCTGEPIAP